MLCLKPLGSECMLDAMTFVSAGHRQPHERVCKRVSLPASSVMIMMGKTQLCLFPWLRLKLFNSNLCPAQVTSLQGRDTMTTRAPGIQYTSPTSRYILLKIPFPPGLQFEPGQVSPGSSTFSESPIPTETTEGTSKSRFFAASPLEKLRLHRAGECHPCVAFAFRAAGCYKGDKCSHCHFCTASQATARRRQLQAAARQKKKQRPADQAKEAATARILAGEPFWL